MTAKETLALWDRAVALQRTYWFLLHRVPVDSVAFQTVKDMECDAVAAFITATGLSGPTTVSLGGPH